MRGLAVVEEHHELLSSSRLEEEKISPNCFVLHIFLKDLNY